MVIKAYTDPSKTLDNQSEASHEPLADYTVEPQRLVNDDWPSYETKERPLWRLIDWAMHTQTPQKSTKQAGAEQCQA